MKEFEEIKSRGSLRGLNCRRVKPCAEELNCLALSTGAPTVIEGNLVYAVDIDDDEVISRSGDCVDAGLAGTMSQLDAEAKRFKSGVLKMRAIPKLDYCATLDSSFMYQ